MPRTITPATPGQALLVDEALDLLRDARDKLLEAQAPRSAVYVRRAIKSAEGAKRHVGHRCRRAHHPLTDEHSERSRCAS